MVKAILNPELKDKRYYPSRNWSTNKIQGLFIKYAEKCYIFFISDNTFMKLDQKLM